MTGLSVQYHLSTTSPLHTIHYITVLLYYIHWEISVWLTLFHLRQKKVLKNASFMLVRVLNPIITNQIFKLSLFSNHTNIWIYKTFARPAVSYCSESWMIGIYDQKISDSNRNQEDYRTHAFISWKKWGYYETTASSTNNSIYRTVLKKWKEHDKMSSRRNRKRFWNINQKEKEVWEHLWNDWRIQFCNIHNGSQ
jgi:hypothetical protein